MSGTRGRRIAGLLVAALVAGYAAFTVTSASAASSLLSQGRPTTASSTENAASGAALATDGDTGTRWSSAFSDPQWIQVDLGATVTICQVVLNWEAAYARSFSVQVSTNGTTWTSVYSTTTGTGGVQTLAVSGSGQPAKSVTSTRAARAPADRASLIRRGTPGADFVKNFSNRVCRWLTGARRRV